MKSDVEKSKFYLETYDNNISGFKDDLSEVSWELVLATDNLIFQNIFNRNLPLIKNLSTTIIAINLILIMN